jgi:hypothetical protein
VEQRCYAPVINSRFYPNTLSSWFWSSSPNAGIADYAWFVYFYSGYVYSYNKSYAYDVRLVRGGQ